MKNILIILAAILLSINTSFAGNDNKEAKSQAVPAISCSISGKILDHVTGESLAGVKVSISGTDLVTYTDLEGNFSCDGIAPGTYNIQTNYISYESTTFKDVVIKSQTDNTVKMVLNPVQE
jgi:hypothetical protein